MKFYKNDQTNTYYSVDEDPERFFVQAGDLDFDEVLYASFDFYGDGEKAIDRELSRIYDGLTRAHRLHFLELIGLTDNDMPDFAESLYDALGMLSFMERERLFDQLDVWLPADFFCIRGYGAGEAVFVIVTKPQDYMNYTEDYLRAIFFEDWYEINIVDVHGELIEQDSVDPSVDDDFMMDNYSAHPVKDIQLTLIN